MEEDTKEIFKLDDKLAGIGLYNCVNNLLNVLIRGLMYWWSRGS